MLAPAEIPHLKAEIAADRRALRAGLQAATRSAGAAERDRLRWIASCDRAQLWRDDGARHMAEWLSAQLHVSNWKSRRFIEAAHALERLPHISAALETGALSLDKTVELARFAAPEDEAKLLMWARRVTVARIRERGDEATRADDREVAEAHSSRSLWWNWDAAKLRLDVQGYLAGDDAQRFVDAVDTVAKELPDTRAAEQGSTQPPDTDEEASLDQRRADALVLLATSAGGDRTTKPTVVVHAPLAALAKDEGNCCTDKGDVLHPDLVRKLTCDARLRFVLTDDKGDPLGIGRSSRSIPGWLREQVLRRDGYRCTFPGCEARRFVDVHHIKHWTPHRGPTQLHNLGTACSGHHPLLHLFGWEMALEENQIVWYAPRGQRYEPGRAPPQDPDPPPKVEPTAAEVAGYSRIFDLLKVL